MDSARRFELMQAGVMGLLVGDALGVPYEFHAQHEIPVLDAIEMQPPRGFARSYPNVLPGTWSDDGAQALCLLESLLACDSMNVQDFGENLVEWLHNGHMAVDNAVFDVGNTSVESIKSIDNGTAAYESGLTTEESNGNGSLMRVLPLAIWHRGSDEELVRDAMLQSCTTHRHLRSQLACGIYCLWARAIINRAYDPWHEATQKICVMFQSNAEAMRELMGPMELARPAVGNGSGYVVETLHSARAALSAGSYEQVIKYAIALGNDTDTTAAVAGGLAALRDGISAIPRRWITALRGQELLAPIWKTCQSEL